MRKNRFYEPQSTSLTANQIAAVEYAGKSLVDTAADGDATIVTAAPMVMGPGDATANELIVVGPSDATHVVACATIGGGDDARVNLLVASLAQVAFDPTSGTSATDGSVASSATTPNDITLENLLDVRNNVMQRQR